MALRKRMIQSGAALLAGGLLAMAGERTAGDIRLDCESLNACGASFSSAGGVELGWTVGQHGLNGDRSSDAGVEIQLQEGIWSDAEAGFAGTVFMFR